MDIDFPLVLSWAVLISGLIWLADLLLLKPRRERAADALEAGGTDRASLEALLREPRLVEYARSFFPVLLLVLVLRSFLAEPYQIPSESMVPNLQVGDFILVNKYAYGLRLPVFGTKIVDIGLPERGDIMVFVPPHDSRYFIKRVVGLPGDHIRYENKAVYVNGERADYELLREFERPGPFGLGRETVREYRESFDEQGHRIYRSAGTGRSGEWVVPAGSYFMMGDNRDRSDDSRGWDIQGRPVPFVPERNIVGKAAAIWVHKDPGWHWPTFERNRWFD